MLADFCGRHITFANYDHAFILQSVCRMCVVFPLLCGEQCGFVVNGLGAKGPCVDT